MDVNMSPEDQLAALFRTLGQAVRLQILLVIRSGSACVCHLEAYLGLRQALISQHLMVLRDAGLVETQREGRNIYYRLVRCELIDLVRTAAVLAGLPAVQIETGQQKPLFPCPCPHCNPENKPAVISCSSKSTC
jgi:ArsR family transcriptional regulator